MENHTALVQRIVLYESLAMPLMLYFVHMRNSALTNIVHVNWYALEESSRCYQPALVYKVHTLKLYNR